MFNLKKEMLSPGSSSYTNDLESLRKENLQEALKLNLELENYEVSCASDGPEAQKKVEQEYFDLIMLQIHI